MGETMNLNFLLFTQYTFTDYHGFCMIQLIQIIMLVKKKNLEKQLQVSFCQHEQTLGIYKPYLSNTLCSFLETWC